MWSIGNYYDDVIFSWVLFCCLENRIMMMHGKCYESLNKNEKRNKK